jgi:pre-mRNA-splicing factor 38A
MANRIDPLAASIKGSDPRNLLEKITREKVYGSVYWKQECFGLTAESIVDKAAALR